MHFKKLKSKKYIHLVTHSYPFGIGEEFLENEVVYLSQYFDHVYIYPINKSVDIIRAVPFNVSIVETVNTRLGFEKFWIMLTNPGLIKEVLLVEFKASLSKIFFLNKIFTWISVLCYAVKLSSSIVMNKEGKNYFYSFWMNEGALALGILKRNRKIDGFFCRVHGVDLYEEQRRGRYMPFRRFIVKYIDNVYVVSNMAMQYFKQRIEYPEKVRLSKLGVNENGINPWNDQIYTIVSCSNVIPIKRVHLIIEILKLVKEDIKWIHFGGGELLDSVLNLAKSQLPSNIQYEFKGQVSNDAILSYYSKNCVNLFIHLSETEGLPVSIMEAISFGVPIIATDVGGVREIVVADTGILLEKNFDIEEAREILLKFKSSKRNSIEFRKGVKFFWHEQFNAKKNYLHFIQQITSMQN